VGGHGVLVGGDGDVAHVSVVAKLHEGCAEVGLEVIPPEAEVLVPVGPHLEGGGWGKLSLCDELV